jgi:hypothetical protein
MIDITIARLTHVEWTNQLELALQKKSSTLDLKAYNECDLGVWLYGKALGMFEEMGEVELLEQEHKLFHLAADKVVKWHNSPRGGARHDAQAQMDFEEVKRRSKEIIYLLTMLEFKMLKTFQSKEQTANLKSLMMNPIKRLTAMIKRR